MKNKYKFRLWDISKNKWATVINQLINRTGIEKYYEFNSNDRFVYQLSTGIKDSNGKEIYEGDIVKSNKEHFVYLLGIDIPVYDKGIVEFICQGFNICQENIGRTNMEKFCVCDCCSCGLEIIGNVYEN